MISSGGGGGYWGGKSGTPAYENEYVAVSSSGSSYVSGYEGCKAVDKNGIIQDHSIHYSGLEFTNIKIEDGLQIFLSPLGIEEKGHSGDGAILILPINVFFTCKKQNIQLNLRFFIFIQIFIKNI